MFAIFQRQPSEIDQEHLERGDLVLFPPDGSIGATIIDIATHSHYHHVALYDTDDMVIEAEPSGVRRYPIGKRKIIGIRLPLNQHKKSLSVDWAVARIGKPYDRRAIILIGIDRVFPNLRSTPDANRYTCAVFVSESYHAVGIDLLPGHDWGDLVPGDFLDLFKVKPTDIAPNPNE